MEKFRKIIEEFNIKFQNQKLTSTELNTFCQLIEINKNDLIDDTSTLFDYKILLKLFSIALENNIFEDNDLKFKIAKLSYFLVTKGIEIFTSKNFANANLQNENVVFHNIRLMNMIFCENEFKSELHKIFKKIINEDLFLSDNEDNFFDYCTLYDANEIITMKIKLHTSIKVGYIPKNFDLVNFETAENLLTYYENYSQEWLKEKIYLEKKFTKLFINIIKNIIMKLNKFTRQVICILEDSCLNKNPSKILHFLLDKKLNTNYINKTKFYIFFKHMLECTKKNSFGNLKMKRKKSFWLKKECICLEFFDEIHTFPRLSLVIIEDNEKTYLETLPF